MTKGVTELNTIYTKAVEARLSQLTKEFLDSLSDIIREAPEEVKALVDNYEEGGDAVIDVPVYHTLKECYDINLIVSNYREVDRLRRQLADAERELAQAEKKLF